MPTVSTSKGSMKVNSIKDFCQAYNSDPDAALAALKGFNDQQAAAILIDAGGILSEKSLLDDGISRLERLQLAESESYYWFIKDGNLALTLFCSPGQYESQKIDILTFQCISDDDWQSTAVPEIVAMLNVMKSDYALARQIFYEAQFNGCETIFYETLRSGDTLDYSIYGVQVSAMCCAQRISYDILDKIAVALSSYLRIENAKQATFGGFWHKYKDGKKVGLNERIEKALKGGNRGLLALYDLHRDTTSECSENPGFLRALKMYRNASTHRFTVLHDESLGIDRAKGEFIDYECLGRFEGLTLSTIRLARAALFYFCDAINFAEECRPATPNTMKFTHIVPDHGYIRGHDLKN